MTELRRLRRKLLRVHGLICLSIITVWIVSTIWTLSVTTRPIQVSFMWGAVYVFGSGEFNDLQLETEGHFSIVRSRNVHVFSWPHFVLEPWRPHPARQTSWSFSIPFWLPLIVVAVRWNILERRAFHRATIGHCLRCGYDLHGLSDSVCPECGLHHHTK